MRRGKVQDRTVPLQKDNRRSRRQSIEMHAHLYLRCLLHRACVFFFFWVCLSPMEDMFRLEDLEARQCQNFMEMCIFILFYGN